MAKTSPAPEPLTAPTDEHVHEAHLITAGIPPVITASCLTCGAIAKTIDPESGTVLEWH